VRVPVDEDKGKPLVLVIEKDRKLELKFSAKETGMALDRIVLRKLEDQK
jgi:hypothetical protein